MSNLETIPMHLLRSYAGNKDRFDKALSEINQGISKNAIRNVVLKEAVFTLSNTLSKAWEQEVRKAFNIVGYQNQPEDLLALYDSISMSNLYEVKFLETKLNKTKVTGDLVDKMRHFLNEMLPLHLAVEHLKKNIVMGREPSAPVAVNPNKIVKTCACCFRDIAVVGSTMAHHGYERPRDLHYQTSSCPGISFRPLEVSTDGLVWIINSMNQKLADYKEKYDERDAKKELKILYSRKHSIIITPEYPEWKSEFTRYTKILEVEISHLTQYLIALNLRLSQWKPELNNIQDSDSLRKLPRINQ